MSRVTRFRHITSRPQRRLLIERLEERSMLSASSSLPAAQPAYDPSSILVRFQNEDKVPNVAALLPGAVLEAELSLVPGLHSVALPPDVSVAHAISVFQANPHVLYAEPNYYAELADTVPNDPSWSALYGMKKIEAPKAWDVSTGSTNVIVAVIDTGLDYDHPDLYLNVWINQGEIPASRKGNLADVDSDGRITFWDLNSTVNIGAGKITDINSDGRISGSDILGKMKKDTSGNDTGVGGWSDVVDQNADGRLDDLIGWNASATTKTPTDGHGHGTHVAGTIGAIGNNGVGVAGVNWKTQLMPLKIFNDAGFYAGNTKVIQMFSYAVANGAKISNNSWGGGSASLAMKEAIRAMSDAGHIFVAAAGNNHNNNDVIKFYPASYGLPNIVAVAATNYVDGITGFSNYGAKTVHLGAPGMDIYSTYPTAGSKMGTNYGMSRGTSMATPHVVGSMALLRSLHPTWEYPQVIKQVLDNVDPLPDLQGKTITGGRLNLAKAVINVPLPAAPPPVNHMVTFSNAVEPVSRLTPSPKKHPSGATISTEDNHSASNPASFSPIQMLHHGRTPSAWVDVVDVEMWSIA